MASTERVLPKQPLSHLCLLRDGMAVQMPVTYVLAPPSTTGEVDQLSVVAMPSRGASTQVGSQQAAPPTLPASAEGHKYTGHKRPRPDDTAAVVATSLQSEVLELFAPVAAPPQRPQLASSGSGGSDAPGPGQTVPRASGIAVATAPTALGTTFQAVSAGSAAPTAAASAPPAAWLAAVFAAVSRGDGVSALRTAVGGSAAWVNAQDAHSRDHLTPLMLAAKLGRARCVRALLDEYNADVNAVAERSGYTAIGLAAYGGHADAAAALLAAGADPTRLNRYGESAIRTAQARGHAELAAQLAAHATARGLGAAEAARAAPTPTVTFTLHDGRQLLVRPAVSADASAIRALYTLGQQGYMAAAPIVEGGHARDSGVASGGPAMEPPQAAAAVHSAWLRVVLDTDLRDAAAHYGSIPRSVFWVATFDEATFIASCGGGDDEASATAAAAALRDAHGRRLVGCVACMPHLGLHRAAAAAPMPASASVGAADGRERCVAELQRLSVHPGVRRGGIGALLVRHVEAWAAASGYTHVALSTLATMGPAMALYRRAGYAEITPPGGVAKAFHGQTIRFVEFEREVPVPVAARSPTGSAAAGPI
jgi:GNAT superfamily N-acetyltransferase